MKTESEILAVAFAMLLEKGFSELSTNEIIREAGLTKGGFYYSFKSREDLDQRIIERYIKPYFLRPAEEMQQVLEGCGREMPTGELLWRGFFLPQRFANYQAAIGQEVAFRDFYFLLYESMKKFPEVIAYSQAFAVQKSRILRRILERGQARGEVLQTIDLDNSINMVLAMQDGIQALRVLDDNIDDAEKYRKIQYQMWRELSTEESRAYRDGGVTSAVS